MAAWPRSCPLAQSRARPWLLAPQVTQVTIVIPVRLPPVCTGKYSQTPPN